MIFWTNFIIFYERKLCFSILNNFFRGTLSISSTSHCRKVLPNGLNRDVVWNNCVRKLLKMHYFWVHHSIKILKTFEFSNFDAKNELSGSKIVEKRHLNVQNGQFWQILDHAEERLLKSKFGWKRSKYKNVIKCAISNHIGQF